MNKRTESGPSAPDISREFDQDTEAFKESLLRIMEQKAHWSDSAYAGTVPKERMLSHFKNEYEVFVRDFPKYLKGALAQLPEGEEYNDVRKDLEENILEEETGEIKAGRPHPELFLKIPRGLGFDTSEFDGITLGPAGKAYKEFLEDSTHTQGWEKAVAVSTLFLEGNKYERSVFEQDAPKRPEPPLDQHPLITAYGAKPEDLELIAIHRDLDSAEGDHRLAAWRMLLDHIPEGARPGVLQAMEKALQLWQAWRDEVAAECGIKKGPDGQPVAS